MNTQNVNTAASESTERWEKQERHTQFLLNVQLSRLSRAIFQFQCDVDRDALGMVAGSVYAHIRELHRQGRLDSTESQALVSRIGELIGLAECFTGSSC